MYTGLKHLHSFMPYVLLTVLILALLKSFIAYQKGQEHTEAHRKKRINCFNLSAPAVDNWPCFVLHQSHHDFGIYRHGLCHERFNPKVVCHRAPGRDDSCHHFDYKSLF